MSLRVTKSDSQKRWSNRPTTNQQTTKQPKNQDINQDDQDQFLLAATQESKLVTYNAQGNLVIVQAR